jgi:hypothetical protein
MTGCAGDAPPAATNVDLGSTVLEIGPNGGPVVQIDDQTRAEIAPQGASGQVVLGVSFLQPDLSSPASVSPSEVSATLYLPTGEQTSVRFSSPSGPSSTWKSHPGDFGYDNLEGELTVVIDGQSITRPFISR